MNTTTKKLSEVRFDETFRVRGSEREFRLALKSPKSNKKVAVRSLDPMPGERADFVIYLDSDRMVQVNRTGIYNGE